MLILAMSPVAAKSEDSITAYGIDVKSIFENTRIGVFLPFKGGKSLKTVYAPLITLHSTDGIEFAAVDVGAAAYSDSLSHGYAFTSIGLRVDSIVDRAIGISKWSKTHISSAKLPTIEAGVGAILITAKVVPGANLAIKF